MNHTNANKPGYKHTPLGWIPEQWDVVNQGEIATFVNGKAYKQEELLLIGQYRVLRVGNFFTNDNWYYSNLELDEDKYVTEGDLMYAWSASFGPRYWHGEKVIYHYHIWKVKCTDAVLKEFMFFSLDSLTAIIKAKGANGMGLLHVTKGEMEITPMKLPPIHEQKVISKILATWDEAIQKTQQLIEQLKKRNKGLMQQLLTGKKRLRGFDGKWKNVMLGDVTTKISRRNGELVDAKVYSVTNSNGFVLQSDHFERGIAGADLSNYKIIKANEFAYNPARINVGSIAYFTEPIGIISSLYVCFKTKPELLDDFLWYLLDLELTKHRIESLGEGGVRIYLWYDLFAKIKITLPLLDEQEVIMKILTDADKELKLHEQQLTTLLLQKKGLMQKLLSGEVRVKIDD